MPPEHLDWFAERANLTISPAFRAIEAIDEAGRIHGAVGYDGHTPNACCIHVALDNPAALRHLLKPGFGIPFIEMGKGVLLATVLGTNKRSLRLVPRLGFRPVHRIADGYQPGVDVYLFEMRKESCRYIRAARKAA